MPCLLGNGVRLAAVLGDVRVNEAHDVGSDRGLHDVGQGDGGACVGGHVTFQRLDGDKRTGSGGHWFWFVCVFSCWGIYGEGGRAAALSLLGFY